MKKNKVYKKIRPNNINYLRLKIISQKKEEYLEALNNLHKFLSLENILFFGPIHLPNKEKKITIRKAPSGTGSNTFETYFIKIFSSFFDIYSPSPQILQYIMNMQKDNVKVSYSIIKS